MDGGEGRQRQLEVLRQFSQYCLKPSVHNHVLGCFNPRVQVKLFVFNLGLATVHLHLFKFKIEVGYLSLDQRCCRQFVLVIFEIEGHLAYEREEERTMVSPQFKVLLVGSILPRLHYGLLLFI